MAVLPLNSWAEEASSPLNVAKEGIFAPAYLLQSFWWLGDCDRAHLDPGHVVSSVRRCGPWNARQHESAGRYLCGSARTVGVGSSRIKAALGWRCARQRKPGHGV